MLSFLCRSHRLVRLVIVTALNRCSSLAYATSGCQDRSWPPPAARATSSPARMTVKVFLIAGSMDNSDFTAPCLCDPSTATLSPRSRCALPALLAAGKRLRNHCANRIPHGQFIAQFSLRSAAFASSHPALYDGTVAPRSSDASRALLPMTMIRDVPLSMCCASSVCQIPFH